jgi:hypothetical protein
MAIPTMDKPQTTRICGNSKIDHPNGTSMKQMRRTTAATNNTCPSLQ